MKIFNTLSRTKEEFIPLEEGKVKMYVCGPTVYNFIHIGNARPMIVFDTVRRYFEYKGYDVNYVSNFTDVDDKIIKKAIEEGVDAHISALQKRALSQTGRLIILRAKNLFSSSLSLCRHSAQLIDVPSPVFQSKYLSAYSFKIIKIDLRSNDTGLIRRFCNYIAPWIYHE